MIMAVRTTSSNVFQRTVESGGGKYQRNGTEKKGISHDQQGKGGAGVVRVQRLKRWNVTAHAAWAVMLQKEEPVTIRNPAYCGDVVQIVVDKRPHRHHLDEYIWKMNLFENETTNCWWFYVKTHERYNLLCCNPMQIVPLVSRYIYMHRQKVRTGL